MIEGPMLPVSAGYMKHPPRQMADNDAKQEIEQFLNEITTKNHLPQEKISWQKMTSASGALNKNKTY